ncbi:MAG: DUF418 domain-containing protein [Bacteroidales bacterium]|nr:DUF418 domain-containing protein [Bacteroidales bacterium]
MNNTDFFPVRPSDRIVQIDILRGFALLGILLVNVFGYHASFYHFGEFYASTENPFSLACYHWMVNLGSDKFIFLFSILFGYGFWMLEEKFKDKGFAGFYFRRMASLTLIGFFHILLFWAGDILLLYGLLGLVLLALRKLPTKVMVLLVVFFYFFTAEYLAVRNYLPWLPDPMSAATSLSMDDVRRVYAQGSFWEILLMRVNEFIVFRNINLLYYAPKIFSLFILGYVSGRKNMLHKINQDGRAFFFLMLSFVVAGLIMVFRLESLLTFFSKPESGFYTSVYIFLYETGNAFLGLSYLLMILLITQTKAGMQVLAPFKYAGRMALTNYLMQSVIFTTIFYGYGFGLFAQLRPPQFLLLGLIVFAVEMAWSKILLTRFRYGPMEYVWRKMTYGKWFHK